MRPAVHSGDDSVRNQWVIGNWKMHGSLAENAARVEAVVAGTRDLRAAIGVCVPYPYLAQVAAGLTGSRVVLGAQNVSEFSAGAHTGEVSAAMLTDLGCRLVLVGHSERRQACGEDDATVGRKLAAAASAGLTPVLCVGESLAEREAGVTEAVVARQLQVAFDVAGAVTLARALIAYEPVWAIGTGRSASAEQAQAVHAFIRAWLAEREASLAAVPILYGGSVKAANAAALFAMPDIEGGLVGGASLDGSEFAAICRAA
jgi:triosephosphate isomerase